MTKRMLTMLTLISPKLKKLTDNSISGKKHVKNKAYKAFKSKKKDF